MPSTSDRKNVEGIWGVIIALFLNENNGEGSRSNVGTNSRT